MLFRNEVDEFRRLCQACWIVPEPPAPSRRFDELYSAKIDAWVNLVFPGVSDRHRRLLRQIIRRRVIETGKDHDWTPGQVISLVAVETRRALFDMGWHPG